MSFPNQRIITVKTTGTDNSKGYLQIDKQIWYNAVKDLGAHAFILYLYFASNKYDYQIELSQVAVANATGMARSTYYKNFNELVAKGYLVEVSPNHYYFYDKPQKEIHNIDSDFPQNRHPSLKDRQLCAWENGEIDNIDNINSDGINNSSNTSITGDGSITMQHLEPSFQEKENLRIILEKLGLSTE